MRRRRRVEEAPLERLLEGYASNRLPHALPSGVAQVRCRRCARATVYDVRRARPGRCAWCHAVL